MGQDSLDKNYVCFLIYQLLRSYRQFLLKIFNEYREYINGLQENDKRNKLISILNSGIEPPIIIFVNQKKVIMSFSLSLSLDLYIYLTSFYPILFALYLLLFREWMCWLRAWIYLSFLLLSYLLLYILSFSLYVY